MQFKQLHPNFQLPTQGSEAAGGYDLYMPEAGVVKEYDCDYPDTTHTMVDLGFAAAVPEGFVALILPRSGAGAKFGFELRNTCGVIDADYRGPWKVAVAQVEGNELSWSAGERLFQFIVVPAHTIKPVLVGELPVTNRGAGGFGSTGQ